MSFNFKVVVVGNCDSGKTSLITAYKTGKMPVKGGPSQTAEETSALIDLQAVSAKVGLGIWDIPGNEQTMALNRMYIRDA
jgi:GTPase SAR1 family protein